MSDSLRRLVAGCVAHYYPANRVLIKEGDEGNSLFVVLAGRVHAYSTRTEASSAGPEPTKRRSRASTASMRTRAPSPTPEDALKQRPRRITYGEYLPGELLGEMSLDGGKRAATVKTMVPSWCCVVTRDDILEHLRDEPEFAFELLDRVIRRARAATLSLRQIALNDAYGRITQFLQTHATKRADGLSALSMSHQRIADRVGCARTMVIRVTRDLRDEGRIAVVDGEIVLTRELPPRF